MWRLFEDFVTGFYDREQQVYRVNPGGRRRITWADAHAEDAANRARIPVMEADIILESPTAASSWTRSSTRTRSPADAARAPASCIPTTCTNSSRTFGTARPPRPDGAPHEGILLYPQVGEEPLTAEIRLEGFRIQARTVNLDQDWRPIHEEMLGTIGCAGT